MVRYKLSSAFLMLACLCLTFQVRGAEIALIIDDMGNSQHDTAAFGLPAEVAFSILPLTRYSESFSRRAAAQQREVMLHIPMESLAGNRLGPGALTADMSKESIRHTLLQALATVPDAIGVNNHMGSKLTQLSAPMQVTMELLIEHELFFVDSRTTRFSKAHRIAEEFGVSSLRRNVFLDHDATTEQIDAQFQRLLRLAKKYGYAVGIGHPYPQTVSYLQRELPKLAQKGVILTSVSELVAVRELAKAESQVPSPAALE